VGTRGGGGAGDIKVERKGKKSRLCCSKKGTGVREKPVPSWKKWGELGFGKTVGLGRGEKDKYRCGRGGGKTYFRKYARCDNIGGCGLCSLEMGLLGHEMRRG